MAHEIENAHDLLYTGETPWHGIGDRISEDQAFDINYIKAHPSLNWTCSAQPLFLADGREATTRAIVRDTDQKVLGEVGAEYTILQNAQVIDWFAPFVESRDVGVECMGALRGGSRVFMLGRIRRDPLTIVPGDEVLSYLLLAHAHDGTLRVHVGLTPIRVVCANTLRMARDDKRSKLIQLRHTKNVKMALDQVRETVDLAHRQFVATAEAFRKLAATGCTDETLEQYVKVVFKAPEPKATKLVEVATVAEQAEAEERASRVFPKVRALFEEGMGTHIPGVRGTMWGALNAVSEYVQYQRGSDVERRLDATWFGTGAALVQRATQVALDMAA